MNLITLPIRQHSLMVTLGLFFPLVLRVASAPTADLSFFILAAYATFGRVQAIQALAMSWLFTMISPGIAPSASLGSIGRYAIIFAAFLSVFVRSGVLRGELKVNKIVLATSGLGAFFIAHSALFSSMPDVSILKAVSWILATTTLFSAWSGLGLCEREKLFRSFYLGLIAIMLLSLPLFILPLGYLRNGSGFQGVLSHPQVFGPTMAILGVISASKLFAEAKPSWHYLAVFALSLVLTMASEARTAGVALVIGLAIAIFSVPFLTGKRIRSVLPGLKSRRVWGITAVALALAVIFAPYISEKVGFYISKSGRAGSVETLAEAYDKSRGGLIDKMFQNINKNPLTGIGFGIASTPEEMDVERDPVFGLPIGAAIEKGVMPIALIEELGVPAAFIVAIWIFILIRRAALNGVTALSVSATVLLINMGENVFFSPGGMGMLMLIFFTWAASNVKENLGDGKARGRGRGWRFGFGS